jgi:NhaP-type Na+/H+ or K+/H+ antiporter
MELLVTFGIGMTVGIALGVALTIVVAWTREKIERQRTFDDFATSPRDAW